MTVRILFPRLLVACFALGLTAGVAAQSSEADSRPTNITINSNGSNRLETELTAPAVEEGRPRVVGAGTVPKPKLASTLNLTTRFDQLLLTAMESHLGSTYHYAATGPDAFDCSGFVWRSFQDVGVNFQRGPASSYWATFAPPPPDEQFKFGTLVFFSGLTHVGIVADAKGFYHSSRHNGVIYSPFNDYWLSRVDGFRRVPTDSMPLPAAKAKPRPAKPATAALIEENNQH